MRYRVSEDKVAWRIVAGEGVLLHADSSAYFGLNRTGTLLWCELTRRSMAAEELAAWTRLHFPGAAVELSSDISEFLEALRQHDLLEPVGDGSPGGEAGMAERAETQGFDYERPQLLRFGELEKLILSGE